ncbi:CRISPR-associated protein Csx18 [Gloeothece verrucosa]|uniref:Uncharacterized protein n=1 Tax=Gloeothece verrucosa (strain PCC 7822) TaxID=497965 RepID=E0ULF6_GLOV7|nr:CRISPR-associated protein Csx18 [Gloeothece verrucosa]ADN17786.1 conserved hypothetical protein [Gloeothece verrucosa PCC 7822]
MYLTKRAACVRNIAVSSATGAITLAILLIAPLGLAAVIINTVLVTVSSFAVGLVGDWVVSWLLAPSHHQHLSSGNRQEYLIHSRRQREIEEYKDY